MIGLCRPYFPNLVQSNSENQIGQIYPHPLKTGRENLLNHRHFSPGLCILLKFGAWMHCGLAEAAKYLKSTSGQTKIADGAQMDIFESQQVRWRSFDFV